MFYGTSTNVKSKASMGNTSGGEVGHHFDPIKPGYYVAAITGAVEGTYLAKFKNLPGRWRYLKLTPEFVLLNENETIINRQDWTVGVIGSEDDDENNRILIRPDEDDTKPALFAKTAFLLSAVGFVDEDENVALEQFHPRLLKGQHVVVRVENEAYTAKDGSQKLKNVITNVYPVKRRDIEEFSLYEAPNGMVFANEQGYLDYLEEYEDLLNEVENY